MPAPTRVSPVVRAALVSAAPEALAAWRTRFPDVAVLEVDAFLALQHLPHRWPLAAVEALLGHPDERVAAHVFALVQKSGGPDEVVVWLYETVMTRAAAEGIVWSPLIEAAQLWAERLHGADALTPEGEAEDGVDQADEPFAPLDTAGHWRGWGAGLAAVPEVVPVLVRSKTHAARELAARYAAQLAPAELKTLLAAGHEEALLANPALRGSRDLQNMLVVQLLADLGKASRANAAFTRLLELIEGGLDVLDQDRERLAAIARRTTPPAFAARALLCHPQVDADGMGFGRLERALKAHPHDGYAARVAATHPDGTPALWLRLAKTSHSPAAESLAAHAPALAVPEVRQALLKHAGYGATPAFHDRVLGALTVAELDALASRTARARQRDTDLLAGLVRQRSRLSDPAIRTALLRLLLADVEQADLALAAATLAPADMPAVLAPLTGEDDLERWTAEDALVVFRHLPDAAFAAVPRPVVDRVLAATDEETFVLRERRAVQARLARRPAPAGRAPRA